MGAKITPDRPARALAGSVEDEDVEAGVSHEDGDTTGEGDDENNGHHVGSAGDEGVNDLLLGQATDDTDQDGHEEEPGGSLVEVPLANGQAGDQGRPALDDGVTVGVVDSASVEEVGDTLVEVGSGMKPTIMTTKVKAKAIRTPF